MSDLYTVEAKKAAMAHFQFAPEHELISRQAPTPQVLHMLATRYGLAPGFSLLVQSLSQQDGVFVASALESISVDTDTSTLPSRWLVRLWAEIRDAIDDSRLRETASNVVDLHLKVLAGEAVQRAEWRKVRAKFPEPEAGPSEAAAGVIAAAAWDPNETVGAVSDAVLAFHEMAARCWEWQAGWGPEDDEWARQMDEASIDHGKVVAGPRASEDPHWFETEEGQRWVSQWREGYETFRSQHCQRMDERQQGVQSTYQDLYQRARTVLLDVCRAAV